MEPVATLDAPAPTTTTVFTHTIRRPFNAHVHFRDGNEMRSVAHFTANQFWGGIVMPNLKDAPITTTHKAVAYQARIHEALPEGSVFEPLMTLYLTDETTAEEIRRAKMSGVVFAVKYYPAGATTNSAQGVTKIEKTFPALEEMEKCGLPLLLHGEVTDPEVDVFDREAVFIDTVFVKQLRRLFPRLRMTLEHISTKQGVQIIEAERSLGHPTAASITPQHALQHRNSLFNGGLRPHEWCIPPLKSRQHQQAVLSAAASGDPGFFLGTDSAPHSKRAKESGCCAGGCFNEPMALAVYTMGFEQAGALDKLEAFASVNGPRHYGLSPSDETVTLERVEATIPIVLPFGDEVLVPWWAGKTIPWRIRAA